MIRVSLSIDTKNPIVAINGQETSVSHPLQASTSLHFTKMVEPGRISLPFGVGPCGFSIRRFIFGPKEHYFFLPLNCIGPGINQEKTIGTNTININAQPPIEINFPSNVQKLSGALFTTVSAVTEIGSPLTLGSAVKAEAVAAVIPPAIAGAITEGVNALATPTTAVVAPAVIRLLLIFGRLHPAILSKQTSAMQRRTLRP